MQDQALECKKNTSSLKYKWQVEKDVTKNGSAICAIYVLYSRKTKNLPKKPKGSTVLSLTLKCVHKPLTMEMAVAWLSLFH